MCGLIGITLTLLACGTGDAPAKGGQHEQISGENTMAVFWVLSGTLSVPGPAEMVPSPANVPLTEASPAPSVAPDRTPSPLRPPDGLDTTGLGDAMGAFERGYRDGGGREDVLRHFTQDVIPCESGWDVFNVSPYDDLGLLQFSGESWRNVSNRTGLTDWRNPYHQGYNGAVWYALTEAGSQWPTCWYRGVIP